MSRYRVSSSHPEDIASGAVFAPGELAVGVDAENPYDKAKIEAGVLVETTSPAKRTPKKEEESK